MIAEVAAELPLTGLARTGDLKDRGDALHFDTASLHILGGRYFEEFRRLAGENPAAGWSRGWR